MTTKDLANLNSPYYLMMPLLQGACVKFQLQPSGSRLQQEVAPGKIHPKFTLHSSPKVVMD
jgi:hypothetical protein